MTAAIRPPTNYRWEHPSRVSMRQRARKLLEEASDAASPQRRRLLRRQAFEMAQRLALLEEEGKPPAPLPVTTGGAA